jgi:AcrR family transcriptional regulator
VGKAPTIAGRRVSFIPEVSNRATPLSWNRDQEPDKHQGARGRPQTSRRSRGLTPEAIVKGAIKLADGEGLDAVTMRRLAAALDTRPTSLYAHIASKADLLALMMDEVVGMMLVDRPLPEDWREALSQIARRSHAAYAAHPWVLAAFARGSRLGPNALQHAKQHARAVSTLKLKPADVWSVVAIIDDFVIGNAMRIATRGSPPKLERLLAPGDLAISPELAEWQGKDLARVAQERFEVGLEAFLDAVELRFVNPRVRAGGRQRPSAQRQP